MKVRASYLPYFSLRSWTTVCHEILHFSTFLKEKPLMIPKISIN